MGKKSFNIKRAKKGSLTLGRASQEEKALILEKRKVY